MEKTITHRQITFQLDYRISEGEFDLSDLVNMNCLHRNFLIALLMSGSVAEW